jgi:hypothetical protein
MSKVSRRHTMSMVLALMALLAVAVVVVLRHPAADTAVGAPSPRPTAAAATMPFRAAPVSIAGDTWLSWALMDRRTGQVWGSSTMDEPTWSASMIKAWLAADYLRRAGAMSPPMRRTLEFMIRDSDNAAANQLYALDGGQASIRRLISICGLTNSSPNPVGWAVTNVSARDSVRMGDCIASGKGAGPQWTPWLLDLMRGVRGEGDFGIRDALPSTQAAMVAIKNGYEDFAADGLYHVNCLAIGDLWVMAVMQQYEPQSTWDPDLARGAQRCTQVATQLLAAA